MTRANNVDPAPGVRRQGRPRLRRRERLQRPSRVRCHRLLPDRQRRCRVVPGHPGPPARHAQRPTACPARSVDETVRTFQLTGRGTVPVDAVAVTANLTVTGSTARGYVSIGPTMTATPTTSTINVASGQTLANGLTLRVGAGRQGQRRVRQRHRRREDPPARGPDRVLPVTDDAVYTAADMTTEATPGERDTGSSCRPTTRRTTSGRSRPPSWPPSRRHAARRRRRLARRDGSTGRRAGRGRPADPRPAPDRRSRALVAPTSTGSASPWPAARIGSSRWTRTSATIRRALPDLLAPLGAGTGRPRHRIALHARRRRRGLGPGPQDHLARRQPVRPDRPGPAGQRPDRRVQGVACHDPRGHPVRWCPCGWLCLPDRDDVPGRPRRRADRRGARSSSATGASGRARCRGGSSSRRSSSSSSCGRRSCCRRFRRRRPADGAHGRCPQRLTRLDPRRPGRPGRPTAPGSRPRPGHGRLPRIAARGVRRGAARRASRSRSCCAPTAPTRRPTLDGPRRHRAPPAAPDRSAARGRPDGRSAAPARGVARRRLAGRARRCAWRRLPLGRGRDAADRVRPAARRDAPRPRAVGAARSRSGATGLARFGSRLRRRLLHDAAAVIVGTEAAAGSARRLLRVPRGPAPRRPAGAAARPSRRPATGPGARSDRGRRAARPRTALSGVPRALRRPPGPRHAVRGARPPGPGRTTRKPARGGRLATADRPARRDP